LPSFQSEEGYSTLRKGHCYTKENGGESRNKGVKKERRRERRRRGGKLRSKESGGKEGHSLPPPVYGNGPPRV
jgi:hypothetical protein